MTLTHVLIPVDFSECSDRAVRYAIPTAHRFGARLTFLHVDVWRAPGDHGVEPPKSEPGGVFSEEQIAENLGAMVEQARAAGVEAASECVRSLGIVTAVSAFANDNDVSAILMAPHGYRGMRRFLLGSTTEEVLRTANHPLLVVPGGADEAHRSLDRLLVPVDLSGSTPFQIRDALALASHVDADVTLLYVIEPTPLPGALTGFGTLGDLAPSLEHQVERELKRLVHDASQQLGRDVAYRIEQGSPARTIVDVAESMSADLIVLSRHGLSGIDRFFLGSVTERVTRASSTPVLVVTEVSRGEAVGTDPTTR